MIHREHSKRLALYQQPVWTCEITGKHNLTYQQALESERIEKRNVESKLPRVLRKAILTRVELQTADLNILVDDIINNFKNNYVVGEIVYCTLNNSNYFARIVDVLIENNPQITTEQSTSEISRPKNGRLRFPDAFLQPASKSTENEYPRKNMYKVQLIDEKGRSLEEYIRTVEAGFIRRENGILNHNNIQNFILECFHKNAHPNAPWLLKPNIAAKYYSDSESPSQPQPTIIMHSVKKQKILQQKTIEEQLNERQIEERKRREVIRYPMEDLDLPDYRKDFTLNWKVIDMRSQRYNGEKAIPYPNAGKPSRPIPHQVSLVPPELFDSFLSSWSFLTVFGEPLNISTYRLNEFENALMDTTIQNRPNILVEYHAALLNVIIKERNDDSVNEVIKGYVANSYIEALEEQEGMDVDGKEEETSILPRVERGWQDIEHLKISEKWDHKEIRAGADRRGWMTSLIGCLNDVATPDMVPGLDGILQHIIPRMGSTAAEREKQYPLLTLKQKLDILLFLVNTVIESNLIRNYMEHCQEQMTECRKQKIEVNKELKSLYYRKFVMDKNEHENRKRKAKTETEPEGIIEKEAMNEHINNSNESESLHKHQPSHDPLKKETENENPRKLSCGKPLEVTENYERENGADEFQQLAEEERVLKEKSEHLEICLRKCMTLRLQNLGKDRFYNQYMYFDNIGLSEACDSGRLYIRSPSDPDIQLLMDRDCMEDVPETHYGYGGGRWFVLKLMKEQGLLEESEWLDNRMKELDSDQPSDYTSWWKCYSEPEEPYVNI
ncbi:unnamed protein product [Rhizopus stolonifer]